MYRAEIGTSAHIQRHDDDAFRRTNQLSRCECVRVESILARTRTAIVSSVKDRIFGKGKDRGNTPPVRAWASREHHNQYMLALASGGASHEDAHERNEDHGGTVGH